MPYQTTKILLTNHIGDEINDVLVFLSQQANSFWNTVVYQLRQKHFETCDVQQYFDSEDLLRCCYKDRKVRVSYAQLCKDFKDNPHYQWLGGQQAQQLLKSVVESFRSYNALLELWFQGELNNQPKLPGYSRFAHF